MMLISVISIILKLPVERYLITLVQNFQIILKRTQLTLNSSKSTIGTLEKST